MASTYVEIRRAAKSVKNVRHGESLPFRNATEQNIGQHRRFVGFIVPDDPAACWFGETFKALTRYTFQRARGGFVGSHMFLTCGDGPTIPTDGSG